MAPGLCAQAPSGQRRRSRQSTCPSGEDLCLRLANVTDRVVQFVQVMRSCLDLAELARCIQRGSFEQRLAFGRNKVRQLRGVVAMQAHVLIDQRLFQTRKGRLCWWCRRFMDAHIRTRGKVFYRHAKTEQLDCQRDQGGLPASAADAHDLLLACVHQWRPVSPAGDAALESCSYETGRWRQASPSVSLA